MIKFGLDLKGEMFIYEASDELVEGAENLSKIETHKQVADALVQDFAVTEEGIWRFNSLGLTTGLYTGTLKAVGCYEDGDFDLLLENIKKEGE